MNERGIFFEASDEVILGLTTAELFAFQRIPKEATGLVVFAHGSGSSRYSVRDQQVAKDFFEAGLGVLLMDLLTQDEEAIDLQTAELRFDIPFLAQRLIEIIDMLQRNEATKGLSIGLFGASTGAAAALVAAAAHKSPVRAVVSRGGRPDLAGKSLPLVNAPTLLIVGGDDLQVLELNQAAYELMACEKRLEIVPGATHLFPEPGTLAMAVKLARSWLLRYL